MKYCVQRNCASSSASCDIKTGSCDGDGCKPGWEGGDCTQGMHVIKYTSYTLIPTFQEITRSC